MRAAEMTVRTQFKAGFRYTKPGEILSDLQADLLALDLQPGDFNLRRSDLQICRFLGGLGLFDLCLELSLHRRNLVALGLQELVYPVPRRFQMLPAVTEAGQCLAQPRGQAGEDGCDLHRDRSELDEPDLGLVRCQPVIRSHRYQRNQNDGDQ
jgi:hypothetical protein